MDSTSVSAGAGVGAVESYDATMAKRAMDQQRMEGAQALKLIQSSVPSAAEQVAVLPPGATFSVRV